MLAPFLLERRLLPKVWGGRALESKLGIPLPAGDEPIGEAWELFDRPDGSSRLRGSDGTLSDLVRSHPEELVGAGVPLGHGGTFPLLLKFLDAHQGLSLQVHPDDRQASGDMGKDECCLILHAADDARIVHGVKPGVTKEQLLASWQTPAVEDLLYSFRPKVGDLVHIRPGTPHGIGPGVVAFEVQENSDLTYRFYDRGRDRDLHADEASRVLEVEAHEAPPVMRSTSLADGGELLLATEHFVVRRYQLARAFELPTEAAYLTITVLGGSARVRWDERGVRGDLTVGRSDTVLVPASLARVLVEPQGDVDVVVCGPGAR